VRLEAEKADRSAMSGDLHSPPVLLTIYKISVKHKKFYAYPSQKRILELLAKWQGVRRCRRTLNYWLRAIEDKDLLRRRRRIGHSGEFGLLFRSSLYMITLRGYLALKNAGVDVSKRISAIRDKLRDTAKRAGDGGEKGDRLKEVVERLNLKTVREMLEPG
jgi:hypothetical protein